MTVSEAINFWNSAPNFDFETRYRRANTIVRLAEQEGISLETLVPDFFTRSRLIGDSKLFFQTYGEYK